MYDTVTPERIARVIKAVPSPECPGRDKPHAEHKFKIVFTNTLMDGAVVDCPGKDA